MNFRPSSSSRTMDDKKQYLSPLGLSTSSSGYNLHGSSYSINLQQAGTVAGYRGSNEFMRKLKWKVFQKNTWNQQRNFSDWQHTKIDKGTTQRNSRVHQEESEKHLSQENSLQTCSDSQLAAKIQLRRCCWWFSRRLYSWTDSYSSSSRLCRHRSAASSVRSLRFLSRLLHLHFPRFMQGCSNGWVDDETFLLRMEIN